jgi:RimJ/RimL family protein N-acetyltransferase
MIKAFLEWFLTNSKEDANKVNVKIPTFNKVGKNMALKIGFKEEGIDRQSYQRDGKFYDQYLLGITKNEIKEVLKWEI